MFLLKSRIDLVFGKEKKKQSMFKVDGVFRTVIWNLDFGCKIVERIDDTHDEMNVYRWILAFMRSHFTDIACACSDL